MAEIRDAFARNDNLANNTRATVANRVVIAEGEAYVVVWQVCTRGFGCVPIPTAGDFGGWFCPCCATHYDRVGRIRKGIALQNLRSPVVGQNGTELIVREKHLGPSQKAVQELIFGAES
jgi:ubiquinol-cytochrome c reductase iron-sulfur subunit